MVETPEDRPRGSLPIAAIVAWTVFIAYFSAARGIQNFFPVSVFDMYRAHAPAVVGRVIVRDRAGDASELTTWTGFHCKGGRPVLRDLEACAPDPTSRPLGYILRDQQLHLDEHSEVVPGSEAIAIAIVLRSYRLVAERGAPPHTDCVIARCTARQRD